MAHPDYKDSIGGRVLFILFWAYGLVTGLLAVIIWPFYWLITGGTEPPFHWFWGGEYYG